LAAPFPQANQLLSSDDFRLPLETDASVEDFELALAGMRPAFDKALLEWRTKIEQTLLKLLPNEELFGDEELPKQTPDKTLISAPLSIPEFAILVEGQPIDNLPLDAQRLLRADAVFSRARSSTYYPDGFTNTPDYFIDCTSHNIRASKMAKALLTALGHPDATYLQLKAAGLSFACGRCEGRKCVTWSRLVCSPAILLSPVKHC
jgi:hypothetical protein